MHKIIPLTVAAVVALPGLAAAQQAGMQHGMGVASIRPLHDQFKAYLVASAEKMPEGKYGYQPTPEVRSFGKLVGHVANANYLFCSAAAGEQNPNSTDFEAVAAKTRLIEALKAAFAYCDKAYQMSEMKAMEQATLFGQQMSRLQVLNSNVAHNAEHYGNFVTYLRLNGLVPPSSQGGGM